MRGDTAKAAFGYNSSPHDIRIINNTIHNARIGVRIIFDPTHTDTTNRWINRVTIRGNRLNNIQRQGITAQKVRTLLIEDNEFFGVNNASVSAVDAISISQFAKEVTIRNNKFFKSATGNTVRDIIRAENPILSSDHRAQLYISEDNIFKLEVTNLNINIPKTITTTGLFEYGSVAYLSDTLSVGTSYVSIDTAQNRPRSTTTVKWVADSSETLTITNAGHYRVSGHLVAAAADSDVTLVIGISLKNAAITDDAVTTEMWLDDNNRFHTIPFNFFLNLSANTSIKAKIKRRSGTGNIYIRRGWLTVERLN